MGWWIAPPPPPPPLVPARAHPDHQLPREWMVSLGSLQPGLWWWTPNQEPSRGHVAGSRQSLPPSYRDRKLQYAPLPAPLPSPRVGRLGRLLCRLRPRNELPASWYPSSPRMGWPRLPSHEGGERVPPQTLSGSLRGQRLRRLRRLQQALRWRNSNPVSSYHPAPCTWGESLPVPDQLSILQHTPLPSSLPCQWLGRLGNMLCALWPRHYRPSSQYHSASGPRWCRLPRPEGAEGMLPQALSSALRCHSLGWLERVQQAVCRRNFDPCSWHLEGSGTWWPCLPGDE